MGGTSLPFFYLILFINNKKILKIINSLININNYKNNLIFLYKVLTLNLKLYIK